MPFEPKEKEPKLSDKTVNIINKCMGEKIDNEADDISRCKYKIMNELLNNQDLLRTLHNEEYDIDKEINGDSYRNICIFNFLKLPDLKDKVKNYVCFEINDDGWGDTTEKTIIFRCVSHIDDAKTDWGIPRQDLLGLIIKNMFDWSNLLGMRLVKKSDAGLFTNDGYYYREIIYRQNDPLNTYKKIHSRG